MSIVIVLIGFISLFLPPVLLKMTEFFLFRKDF